MRRKVVRWAALVLLALSVLAPSVALASGSLAPAQRHVREAPITFRLIVPGKVASNVTFWVAYGPLAGHFGIIQLKPAGRGMYTARVTLPIEAGASFSYISGFGRMHTKIGYVPKRVGVTIKTIGPTDALTASARPVRWLPPIG